MLSDAGADVVYVPTVVIADPESWEEVDAAVERARSGDFDWVLFTSANSAERFVRRLGSSGRPLHARVGAVGSATASLLRARGIEVDAVPDEFTADDLIAMLGSPQGDARVLLPRVEDAPRQAVHVLESRGWSVEEVAVYRNLPAPMDTPEAAEVRRGRFDAVTFASGSAAHNFAAGIGEPGELGLSPGDPPGRVVACIGPRTAEAAERAGLRVDLVAEEHTARGLAAALQAHYARRI